MTLNPDLDGVITVKKESDPELLAESIVLQLEAGAPEVLIRTAGSIPARLLIESVCMAHSELKAREGPDFVPLAISPALGTA
eukprot:CAMPEP_0206505026 /NCGR_PEP_ID=MMETSP0324_2-20121206/55865_1 /ASSEMBLY_ACC=CAM_ASM_000836 /TAXON_ID=2866 /ORGANISM="Crypthecodinium cohnii, Strain Seligo" /LENGTH=81 /DNA_ID=CAMNT_0053994367 /DNA_START=17 /DNA_END=259 /DNA_ORIENTATION=-